MSHGSRAGLSLQRERQLPWGKVPLTFPCDGAATALSVVRGDGAGRGGARSAGADAVSRCGGGAGGGLPVYARITAGR
ncbi:hypothetical protein GCM10009549_07580 [Streptomyces thermoalcalitolerans]|uniref:Uncharacterized protein n=1 Tax=Streptomyces thermoalcalitolerans TaxID=65605 RepID=A0ABN1NEF1_9ACTN